jgi:hypothetical protein
MSISSAIDHIIHAADACGQLEAGLRIATYTDATDEGTSLPVELVDSAATEVSDDQELDEMRRALRRHGWSTETDSEGVYLVARQA